MKQKRAQNLIILGAIHCEKALQCALELNEPVFKCSNGWLVRFKEHHGITFKRIIAKPVQKRIFEVILYCTILKINL